MEIPPELQALMWTMIDINKGKKLDYLQVFNLYVICSTLQFIEHSQEQPERKTEIFTIIENPITEKIFVIDDGEHSTMLLASEY
jgi:hypothetical protein